MEKPKVVKSNIEAHQDSLKEMRESPYNYSTTRWAAYQNAAFDSTMFGHVRFLAIGPNNTLTTAPPRFPDTMEPGWKYLFKGWVDLEKGVVIECRRDEGGVDDPKE